MCLCFTSDDQSVTDVKPLEPKTEFSSAGDNKEPLGLGKCVKEKVIHDDKV